MGPIILGVSAPVHRDYGGLFDVCVDHSLIQGDVKDVCEDSVVPEHPAWHVVWVYRFTWVYSGWCPPYIHWGQTEHLVLTCGHGLAWLHVELQTMH